MDKPFKILIVDDEVHISDLLQTNLELEGYRTSCALDGKEAMSVLNKEFFNLVLLDVMLPDISGLELCSKIKQQYSRLPILMLSALGQSSDRIKGLKSGADDYLSKPFNLTELYLRMENLLARYPKIEHETPHGLVSIGNANIDLNNGTLTRENQTHILTPKELQLLKYLISRPNEIIHRKEILNEVWHYDVVPTSRTIDNFISKFRKLIEVDHNDPKIIKTVRGKGYLLIN